MFKNNCNNCKHNPPTDKYCYETDCKTCNKWESMEDKIERIQLTKVQAEEILLASNGLLKDAPHALNFAMELLEEKGYIKKSKLDEARDFYNRHRVSTSQFDVLGALYEEAIKEIKGEE